MKTSTLIPAIAAAGCVAAAPTAEPTKFGLMSLRSASPIHIGLVSAAQSNLFIHLPAQNATCTNPSKLTATFYLKDGELYLYTPANAPVQKVYVDRSGMGQGNLGYSTGQETLPKYAETKGWQIEGGSLSFNGSGLLACPHSIDDAWSIWVSIGIEKPHGQEGCLGFNPRVNNEDAPVQCSYTQ